MTLKVPLSGSLREKSLPAVLNYLHELKNTGTLSVMREGVEKKLFLKKGDIIFASSSYEGDRLGEILLKAGKINVRQFETASKVVRQTKKRVGAVLVELGYLTPKDLFWGVKHQVHEIICSLFSWMDGTYEFKPGELPAAEVITLHMSTANLIMQGIKRIDDWTRISKDIPPMEKVLRITTNPLKLYQDVDITGDEKKVVSLFDGKRTIKEVFEQAGLPDFDVLKAVYIFYSVGMLEDTEADGPPKSVKKAAAAPGGGDVGAVQGLDKTSIHKAYIDSKSQDYYELLKVDGEASAGVIEDAYRAMARLYHPDQQFREGMAQMKEELEELFNKVTEAYSILSDDSRRWEYDLSLTAMGGAVSGSHIKKPKDHARAKEAFDKGVASFRARDFESATAHFKDATRYDSSRADYFSHLALALLQRPRREAEAEEAMLTAVELEPGNAEHRANLGLLYQRAGINDKAKQAFEEAVRLDPANPKALKGLGRGK